MVEKCLGGGGGFGRPRQALTALALSLLASGCYSYTGVSPAAVPPGSSVRVTVTPGAAVGVGANPLPEGTRSLSGKLMEGSTNQTLLLSVALGKGDPGASSRQLRSTVTVPMADVQLLELRRMEKGRTALLIGGGTLGAYLITTWAFNVLDPSSDPSDGGGGGVDNARFVLFRLSW
ncbi:MAG TPA: hypothetical protein VLH75_04555 [Longimicrobiales bacterium]|nr:hypothetical protein [Longimicrobiales bacterium]